MKKSPQKQNPHCPIAGCKTKASHLDDPNVKGLVNNFSSPSKVALWTVASIAELGNSMAADLAAGRHFALISRSRQLEELYIRALYTIFVATHEELAHIMSDALPNSFRAMYRQVNLLVFEGRGLLEVSRPGLTHGSFTPMDTINRGAHVSFSTMMTVIGLAHNPEYLEVYTSGRYFDHVSVYCSYLDHARKLFEAGRDRATVLAAVTNMHRPRSYWEALAKVAATAEARKKERSKGITSSTGNPIVAEKATPDS